MTGTADAVTSAYMTRLATDVARLVIIIVVAVAVSHFVFGDRSWQSDVRQGVVFLVIFGAVLVYRHRKSSR